jgi:hypothetical protein
MKKTSLILSTLLILFAGGVFADGTQSQSNLPACSLVHHGDVPFWTNCIGSLTYYDGDSYVGEYKDGKYHGQGTFTWLEGPPHFGEWIYVGEWKDDKRHGQGTMTYPDGSYVGGWKEGERHGQGTFIYADGRSSYVGEWKEGKRQE